MGTDQAGPRGCAGHPDHPDVVFFERPSDFRAWLREHHETADVQWVGFWKKGTGRASITWPESVEEALCYGWIDGLRKSIDDEAYMIRFTPRRPRSHWSRKNVDTYRALDEAGRIKAAGREAWGRRDPENTARASFEREDVELAPELRAMLDADPEATAFFDAQPPGYRRRAMAWVMSAKREATRERRMAKLVEDSAAGQRTGGA